MNRPGRSNMIFHPMSKNRWESLIRLKQEMADTDTELSMENVRLDPRIAESWRRCLAEGLHADKPLPEKGGYDRRAVSRAMAAGEDLINAARSVFDQIYQYLDESLPYYLELVDRDNVRLLERGLYDESIYNNPIPGEDDMGTNCHWLVREHRCPVMISGPENYLEICYNYFTWGVPVFDEIGTYCGGVFLSKRFAGSQWMETNEAEQRNNLYFTCAIALAVERCWMASRAGRKFKEQKAFGMYLTRMVLDFVEDGVVMIDRDGYILEANTRASTILDLHDRDTAACGNVHIPNYMAEPQKFSLLLQKHQSDKY